MEELMKQIIQLLKKRENSVLELTYRTDMQLGSDSFIQAKKIKVSQVDFLGLLMLQRLDATSSWLQTILEGISYGVFFELQLNCEASPLLPSQVISSWPLAIYDKSGYRLRAYPTKAITYQQVAVLKPSDKLLLRDEQLLTVLAKERLQATNIEWIERCC